jgi:hypothetical protein
MDKRKAKGTKIHLLLGDVDPQMLADVALLF